MAWVPVFLDLGPRIGEAWPYDAVNPARDLLILDAAAESHHFIGTIRLSGGATSATFSAGTCYMGFQCSSGVVWASATTQVKIGLVGVTAAGAPDGDVRPYRTLVGGDGIPAINRTVRTTLNAGASRTLTAGQRIGVAFEMSARGGTDSLRLAIPGGNSGDPYLVSQGVKASGWPMVILEADDGTLAYFTEETIPCLPANTTVSTDFAPDELGILFSLPFPAQINALTVKIGSAAVGDGVQLRVYSDPWGATPTQLVAVTPGDVEQGHTATGAGAAQANLTTALTLAANTLYAVTAKFTTSGTLTLGQRSFPEPNWRNAFAIPFIGVTRNNETGAFAEYVGVLPSVGFVVSAIDDYAGAAAYVLDAQPASISLSGATSAVSLDHWTGVLPASIAYWPFNEGTGTTSVDASGNGHLATLGTGIWESALAKFGGYALKTTGSGQGATITAIPLGTVHTIAWWLNGHDGSSDGDIITYSDYYLYFYLGLLEYSMHGSYAFWDNAGSPTGSHHWVVVRENLLVTAYRDGVSLGTKTLGGTGLNNSFSPTVINSFLVGVVDDLRLYDVPLFEAQVVALYNLNPDASAKSLDALSTTLLLTGQDASLEMGYALDAQPGSLLLTGTTASLELGRAIDAQSASLVLTPQSATLDLAHILDALPGTVLLSGQSVSFESTRILDALPATLVLSGQLASLDYEALIANFILDAFPTTLSLSGVGVSLEVGRQLDAGTTSLTITTQAANLDLVEVATSYELEALAATLVILPGEVANLDKGYILNALVRTVVISTQAAMLGRGRSLDTEAAGLTITPGAVVTFDWNKLLNVGGAAIQILTFEAEVKYRRSQEGWDRLLQPPVDGGHSPLSDAINFPSKSETFGPQALHPPVGPDHKPLSEAVHPDSFRALPLRTGRLRSHFKKDPP